MTTSVFPGFPVQGLQFLRSLKRHNNREWFQEHKTIYDTTVKKPLGELIAAMAEEFSSFAPEMAATSRTSAYRIYRDTRFSKDKTPYKTHVAAVFPRTGLGKHEGAAFYLQIDPSEVLIGGGVYMPMPDALGAIRTHLASNHRKFKSIVESAGFQTLFGRIHGEELKRVPRGFPPDHPAADYLKLKQFLVSRTFEPTTATSSLLHKRAVETFRAMLPLIRFLNSPILDASRLRLRQDAVLR